MSVTPDDRCNTHIYQIMCQSAVIRLRIAFKLIIPVHETNNRFIVFQCFFNTLKNIFPSIRINTFMFFRCRAALNVLPAECQNSVNRSVRIRKQQMLPGLFQITSAADSRNTQIFQIFKRCLYICRIQQMVIGKIECLEMNLFAQLGYSVIVVINSGKALSFNKTALKISEPCRFTQYFRNIDF